MKREAVDASRAAAAVDRPATQAPVLFELDRVRVRLGSVHALQDVSVRIRHGERVALVRPKA